MLNNKAEGSVGIKFCNWYF